MLRKISKNLAEIRATLPINRRIISLNSACPLTCLACPVMERPVSKSDKLTASFFSPIWDVVGGDPLVQAESLISVTNQMPIGDSLNIWTTATVQIEDLDPIASRIDWVFVYVPRLIGTDYCHYTGVDKFEAVMANIRQLKAARLKVFIVSSVSELTVNDLAHHYEQVLSLGTPWLIVKESAGGWSSEGLRYVNRYRRVPNVYVRQRVVKRNLCLGYPF